MYDCVETAKNNLILIEKAASRANGDDETFITEISICSCSK